MTDTSQFRSKQTFRIQFPMEYSHKGDKNKKFYFLQLVYRAGLQRSIKPESYLYVGISISFILTPGFGRRLGDAQQDDGVPGGSRELLGSHAQAVAPGRHPAQHPQDTALQQLRGADRRRRERTPTVRIVVGQLIN
jgi:hypothetical protein